MIASENVNRLYISVCEVIRTTKRTAVNVEFWVNQYQGTDGHEVTDEEAQRVVDHIKKIFKIK